MFHTKNIPPRTIHYLVWVVYLHTGQLFPIFASLLMQNDSCSYHKHTTAECMSCELPVVSPCKPTQCSHYRTPIMSTQSHEYNKLLRTGKSVQIQERMPPQSSEVDLLSILPKFKLQTFGKVVKSKIRIIMFDIGWACKKDLYRGILLPRMSMQEGPLSWHLATADEHARRTSIVASCYHGWACKKDLYRGILLPRMSMQEGPLSWHLATADEHARRTSIVASRYRRWACKKDLYRGILLPRMSMQEGPLSWHLATTDEHARRTSIVASCYHGWACKKDLYRGILLPRMSMQEGPLSWHLATADEHARRTSIVASRYRRWACKKDLYRGISLPPMSMQEGPLSWHLATADEHARRTSIVASRYRGWACKKDHYRGISLPPMVYLQNNNPLFHRFFKYRSLNSIETPAKFIVLFGYKHISWI